MTKGEVVDLLTAAAMFDRRTVGKADTEAWLAVVGDLPFDDALAAVRGHYTDSTDWLMPAHVRRRVKAMRADRLARQVIPHPGHELADQPGRYKAALAAMIRRIGDGFGERMAIAAAPEREGPPPEAVTEAIGQARAKFAPPPLTPQELAAQQAAESRAEREAADRKETPDD
jgi:hypothetical protein